VAYAVENNLTIEQYELDLQDAMIDRSDAVGAFLPDANSSLSASGNTGLSFDPTNNQPVTTTIFTATGGVTSSVTLFDGLRNIHRLNRAKLNALANQYRLDDLKDDIRLSVANAYLQILSNKETLIGLFVELQECFGNYQNTVFFLQHQRGVGTVTGADKDIVLDFYVAFYLKLHGTGLL